jgi:hypothetical protein
MSAWFSPLSTGIPKGNLEHNSDIAEVKRVIRTAETYWLGLLDAITVTGISR